MQLHHNLRVLTFFQQQWALAKANSILVTYRKRFRSFVAGFQGNDLAALVQLLEEDLSLVLRNVMLPQFFPRAEN